VVLQACPISRESRNERVVRAVAVLVAAVTAAAVAAGPRWAPWVLLALAADFAVRGFGRPVHSPLATVGRIVVNFLGLPAKPVDAAPKRFAARIGVVFSAGSAALFAAGATTAAVVVAPVLIVCAVLEAAFAFCVGCRVYALLPSRLAGVLAR
jgi:Domain of unknown function (DUF4395)